VREMTAAEAEDGRRDRSIVAVHRYDVNKANIIGGGSNLSS